MNYKYSDVNLYNHKLCYKFISIIYILFLYINENIFLKFEEIISPPLNILTQRSYNFNTSELEFDMDRQIYNKNKTEFYLNLRIKFLLKYKVIYNDSHSETIQDKFSWLDIHESPQYKSFMTDKIKISDYSKKILGKDICVPLLKIYDNPYEINLGDLPNKFVIKYNHGSGMNEYTFY